MMGPDDFGERKQTSHAPNIALAIAGVLLLGVGAVSLYDFLTTRAEEKFKEKYEEQYAEKERELLERYGRAPEGGGDARAAAGGRTGQSTRSGTGQSAAAESGSGASANGGARPQRSASGGRDSGATGTDSSLAQNASRAQSSLPTPNDPELDAYRQSLQEAEERSRRTEERYREITDDVDSQARRADGSGESSAGSGERGADGGRPASSGGGARGESAAGGASGSGNGELPGFLREAVNSPPGGNPDVEKRLERQRKKVQRLPSLGKVTSYDKDWGIVTFDAGASQGVKKGQRFAVRRGGENIVGWIKVKEVRESQSIASLVTKNRNSDTAAKPAPGDDLIDFELP